MIRIEVDKHDLKNVQKRLGALEKKAPIVVSRALNKTATSARQQLATQTKKVYTYKKSVRGQMEIRKSSAGNLSAQILSNGKPHNLTSFTHSSGKRKGASAAQLKGSGKKNLIGPRGIKAWKTGARGGAGGGLLQRTGKKRYPLKFLSGTSTPKMIENEKVYGVVEPEIREKLQKNIDNQIKLLVGS